MGIYHGVKDVKSAMQNPDFLMAVINISDMTLLRQYYQTPQSKSLG